MHHNMFVSNHEATIINILYCSPTYETPIFINFTPPFFCVDGFPCRSFIDEVKMTFRAVHQVKKGEFLEALVTQLKCKGSVRSLSSNML